MNRTALSTLAAVISFALVGCQSTASTTVASTTVVSTTKAATTATATVPATSSTTAIAVITTPAVEQPNDGLQLALTIHVERHPTEVADEAEFNAHIAMLEQLANLAIAYDVVLNFELSTEFVDAVDNWDSTFIEDMTALGHAVAQHSGDQSTAGLTGAARVAELVRQRDAIEAHGVEVNYVSGGCSADDWVEAAIAAGFSAVTGNVEYCLKSLDDATLPDGMQWIDQCNKQSICHDPLHVGTARVLHPWTTSSSATWLVDDPEGKLVIISSDEADGFVAMSQGGDSDLNLSLEQWTDLLDSYVAATVARQVNVVNMVLSVGPEPDWELIESMFAQALARQDAGLLTWANLGDVVAQALVEAPTQAADPTVVYTDVTPDLGGGF